MIESDRFRSFLSEPPCTTYSPAAHPAVRSYAEPLGYDRTDPKTWLGNLLAFRSFLLLRHGRRFGRPCGTEQPRLSKMAWLEAWARLLELGFEEAIVASCQFDKKEFRFLIYLLDPNEITTRCPGGHEHVRIEGAHTKKSSVYTWGLAEHLAEAFAKALRRVDLLRDLDNLEVGGYESVVVNDVLLTATWKKEKCWAWKRKSHINVLEANAGLAMLRVVASGKQDCRFVGLLDSRVAKGALAKGRSTSLHLQKACRRSAAMQLGFGLYPGWAFAPTRLNVADDPTRKCDVRAPVRASVLDGLSGKAIQVLHSGQFARWASNWIRLIILVGHLSLRADAESVYHVSSNAPHDGLSFSSAAASGFWRRYACLISVGLWISTCVCGLVCCLVFVLLSFPSIAVTFGSRRPWSLFLLLWAIGPSVVEAMEPRSVLERERAARRSGIDLFPTRVARKETLTARAKLLADFRIWLYGEHKVSLTHLLSARPPDPEEICRWLTSYGQEMFLAGKAYGKFAETINAVATARPALRKSLSQAWDLAFA